MKGLINYPFSPLFVLCQTLSLFTDRNENASGPLVHLNNISGPFVTHLLLILPTFDFAAPYCLLLAAM